MDRQPLYFTILILSILIGSSFYLSWSVDRGMGQVSVERLSIESAPGRLVELLVYSPRTGNHLESMPVMLTIHGLTSSKEGMYAFNVELARRNFTVVSIDLPGHGDSTEQFDITDFDTMAQDAYAAIRHIQTTFPNVDNESYGVLSHSLGFRVAIELSDFPVVPKAFVAVGDVGKLAEDEFVDFPDNLLFAVGLSDEIVTQQDALLAIQTATGDETATSGITYGSLDNQTAFRLAFGPSNHAFEVVDITLVNEAVSWLVQGVQGEVQLLDTLDPADQVYSSKTTVTIAVSVLLFISVIPVMWLAYGFLPEKLKPRQIPLVAPTHSFSKTLGISSVLGAGTIIIFVVASFIGLSLEDIGVSWLNLMSASGLILFLILGSVGLLILMFLILGRENTKISLAIVGIDRLSIKEYTFDILKNLIIAGIGIIWLMFWLGLADTIQPTILLVLVKWPVGIRGISIVILTILAIPFLLLEAAWIRGIMPSSYSIVGEPGIHYSWSADYRKAVSFLLTLFLKFAIVALLTVITIFGTTSAGVSGGRIVLIGVIWVRILIIQVFAATIIAWTSNEFENIWSAVIISAFILSLVVATTIPLI